MGEKRKKVIEGKNKDKDGNNRDEGEMFKYSNEIHSRKKDNEDMGGKLPYKINRTKVAKVQPIQIG